MEKYRMLNKKGEGTFSEVIKCQNIKDGTFWACKKMKQRYNSTDELKEIREIQALRYLSKNPYILQLHEVVFERKTGTLNLIFELMDMNLYELIKLQRNYMNIDRIAKFTYQMLRAIEHMHKFGYFHRDIKPENILVKGDLLKLADFGSCRRINTKHPYTEYISTRWYRSPECLLTDGFYSYPMDIWGAGCVLFEMITLNPLFPGSNELDQIDKIHDILGTPDQLLLEKFKKKSRTVRYNFRTKKGIGLDRYMNTFPPDGIDLVKLLCTYDPDQRITANRALKHKFFDILIKNEKENVMPDTKPRQKKSIDSSASEPVNILADLYSNQNSKAKKNFKKYNSNTSLANYKSVKAEKITKTSFSNIEDPIKLNLEQNSITNMHSLNQYSSYPPKKNYLYNNQTNSFLPKLNNKNNSSTSSNQYIQNDSPSSIRSMLSKVSNYSNGLPDIFVNTNPISNYLTDGKSLRKY
ncbi:unnamed protein product [Brachionus calyciflorus]|uniref:Protein kinase domain-containing protein n=1 Tax=Brachionus calyciflorus TaxID=104777 RepID=A0A814AT87_9BILA|nr:unnamed protein product [Brachionus calyciflorus]